MSDKKRLIIKEWVIASQLYIWHISTCFVTLLIISSPRQHHHLWTDIWADPRTLNVLSAHILASEAFWDLTPNPPWCGHSGLFLNLLESITRVSLWETNSHPLLLDETWPHPRESAPEGSPWTELKPAGEEIAFPLTHWFVQQYTHGHSELIDSF